MVAEIDLLWRQGDGRRVRIEHSCHEGIVARAHADVRALGRPGDDGKILGCRPAGQIDPAGRIHRHSPAEIVLGPSQVR